MFVRVIASVFAVALVSGCAAQNHTHNQYVTQDQLKSEMARVDAAVKAADAAAKRAETAAEKAEVIFNKSLQK